MSDHTHNTDVLALETKEYIHWSYNAVLQRAPSELEVEHYAQALTQQHISKELLAVELLKSEEYANLANNREFVPHGHFYSAVPSFSDRQTVLTKPRALDAAATGLDMDDATQLGLLDEFKPYYEDHYFPEHEESGHRYFWRNNAYSRKDAFVLQAMIRHFQPNKIIEVGSGFSSAVMLDTVDRYVSHKPEITFIEPYPETLKARLSRADLSQHRLLAQPVQVIPMLEFEQLAANDIFFIDSTHVSKLGSDVNYLLLEILPRLKTGVIVHIHDIFYPFEYPPPWIKEGRAWNEIYLLRALLQNNAKLKVLMFNHYMSVLHKQWFDQNMPLLNAANCGSIWLKV